MVEKVFRFAASDEPCILYFEDADLMIGSGKNASTRDVKVQFCIQLDWSKVFNRAVFVIVATNKPWEINHKLMSRFEEMVFVDCHDRPYGRKMRGFRINNDPKYNPEGENYYSLLDAFPCFAI
jgi:SpoVK/Ycf46/Vps4 family AAA+-type ATPase